MPFSAYQSHLPTRHPKLRLADELIPSHRLRDLTIHMLNIFGSSVLPRTPAPIEPLTAHAASSTAEFH